MAKEHCPPTRPQDLRNGSSGECPSCGRFVGPLEKCPYCGADIGQRMAIRVFKYGSLVLAILGLVVLRFVAAHSQAPTVEIGGLTGTMNWAFVRIEGLVTQQPSYDPEAETLRFWIQDGTGEITVVAYRSEAEVLLDKDLVPSMGDQVAVEGTLRIKEGFQYLVVDVPQHTEVRRAAPVEMTVAEVHGAPLYQVVTVRAVVRADRTPYEGLRILTLRDTSADIEVTLPSEKSPFGGVLPKVSVGQSVQVTGAVDQYKGAPQISVGRGSNLEVLDEAIAIAPARRIGELSMDDVDSMVAVEGVIAQVSSFSAGVRCKLDDGSGAITLLLWQDMYDLLPDRDALAQGATIRAQGEVAEYRGELEIAPELPADVMVLAAGEPAVVRRRLGELTTADVDRVVQVEGVITSLRDFSAGVAGTLDDGTGTIALLLWRDVYDDLAGRDPTSVARGAVLRVAGEVREYEGELEIVPLTAGDVAFVGTVELPTEERSVGQIAAADVGQMVQVSGQIAEVMPFSKGTKYTLDDGTGSITVLLWQNVYDQLDDPDALAVGTEVSVRGEVVEYQAELELVPQAPADVVVTRRGEVAQVTATPTPEDSPTPEPTQTPVPTAEPTATPNPTPTVQPTAPPEPTATPEPQAEVKQIGQIVWDDIGQTFTIKQATITDAWGTSGGANYRLSDGTGTIILFVFQDDYEEMSLDLRYDLVQGTVLDVTGEIGEWRGDLEIIPRERADLKLRTVGEHPPLEERKIIDITPSDVGRWFRVEATIQAVQTSSSYVKLVVGDGTGQIVVLLWQNIYERVPDREQLNTGALIRVVGEFSIYEKGGNEFQIVPLAGADVEVLP